MSTSTSTQIPNPESKQQSKKKKKKKKKERHQPNLVPRVSHLLALGGKMRDPGNEVDISREQHSEQAKIRQGKL